MKMSLEKESDFIAKVENNNICFEIINENYFFEFTKKEVIKVFEKNIDCTSDLFDILYVLSYDRAKNSIKKIIERKSKSKFMSDINCLDLVDKVVLKTAKNVKNIFEKEIYDLNKFNQFLLTLISHEEVKLEAERDQFIAEIHLRTKAKAIEQATRKLVGIITTRANELRDYNKNLDRKTYTI
jgi:hypothetical protein